MTEWLNWTETPDIHFPQYYRLEVQDQGANMLRFCWEASCGMQIVKSPLYPRTAQSRKGSPPLVTLLRSLISLTGLPRWRSDKESTYQRRRCGFDPWVGKIPWRKKWQLTPVFLPGKIPWAEEPGRLVKSRTWLSNFPFTFHFHALEKEMATHSRVLVWRILRMVEPGGLPSYGVTQSRTRLKWLSSSSSILLNTTGNNPLIIMVVCVMSR